MCTGREICTVSRLALVNGKVITMAPGSGKDMTAVLLGDGLIQAVGTDRDIREQAPSKTQILDLEGKVLLPGFIDAHLHPLSYASSREEVTGLPPEVASLCEIQRQITERARVLPPGSWILGQGYDDTRLKEQRHPDRADLDAVAGDNPVVIRRVCGHMSVASSRALEMAGIDPDTPDPPGGVIVRDRAGRPTGLLLETAQHLLQRVIPPRTPQDLLRLMGLLSHDLLSHGITGCCHAGLGSLDDGEARSWAQAIDGGMFRPRMTFLPTLEAWKKWRKLPAGERLNLDVRAVKIFADGSISGRTAALFNPYQGGSNDGLLVHTPAELCQVVSEVVEHGGSVAVHAMGDRAITLFLDAVEKAGSVAHQSLGHRIEHCSLPLPGDMQRMARLGVVPVLQPVFMYAEGEAYLTGLGEERSRRAYPMKTLGQMGIPFALSSDAPATSWADATNVPLGMESAVRRLTWAGSSLGQDECITASQALTGYTIAGARTCGFAPQSGSIEAGKLGDLVVLDRDPRSIPPDEIGDLRVLATLMEGEILYGEIG